ncbi:DUF6418 domain-containing protein [Rossellomorea sp. KS-H15a]|uniref:DUF6418 domain-containing protein n=1 Tax=Rossellomorea sp. KS-H15a TaxID=2963940 RepID=UPI0020C6AC7E|nr:DUF6418 domain-containing protein [Rossellomorea sp. KS-H15a]UTE77501.1 DUF6418 domain-containing protein [Rossellomorea sp. KS-H15a]
MNLIFLGILVPLYYKDISKNKGLRITIWYIVLTVIPCIISLLVIEKGTYISEQKKFGFLNGATTLYIVYIVLLYLGIKVGYHSLFNRIKYSYSNRPINKNLLMKMVIVGINSALVLLYINYLLSPKPYINSGISRFNYWENSTFPFLNSIFGSVSGFMAFSFGYLFLLDKKKKHLISFFLYFLYLILAGNKFSALIIALFLFSIPKLIFIDSLLLILKRNSMKIFIITVIFISLIYYNYSIFNPYSYAGYNSVSDAIIQRISIQGHVFWGSLNNLNVGLTKFTFEEIIYGMRTLMVMLSFYPENHVLYYYNQGSATFTLGYPSILNVGVLFPLGLIINFFVGIFYGMLIKVATFTIFRGRIILAIIAIQLISWMNYMLTMAKFEKLLGLQFWTIVLILMFGLLLSGKNKSDFNEV